MNNITQLRTTSNAAPSIESVQVNNNRPYADLRDREYLTPEEVAQVQKAAGTVGRHKARDRAIIMLLYRHGLRCSELVSLRWQQVDLKAGTVLVKRLKGSRDSIHPLRGPEIRALRQLQKTYDGAYVFTTERGGPLTASTVRRLVKRAGNVAGLPFPIHTHMLRHACGHYLAMAGHDTRAIQQYLGHVNIMHTVRYTELTPARFNDFWGD